jgi:hypothetical protein
MEPSAKYETPLPAALYREGAGPVTRPTAARLSAAIELVGLPGNGWITCSPLPDREGRFIQARRLASGAYEVETRDGLDTEIVAAEMRDGDEVTVAFLERVRAWATERERASIPTTAAPEVPIDPDSRAYAEEQAAAAVAGGFRDFPTIVPDILESNSLRAAAGVGISWASPFGPIRLDFSQAVLKENFDKTERIFFSFGTRF